jgi:hypothetical protein
MEVLMGNTLVNGGFNGEIPCNGFYVLFKYFSKCLNEKITYSSLQIQAALALMDVPGLSQTSAERARKLAMTI